MATELEQIQSLLDQFRRPIPNTAEYQHRLAEEFEIIIQQRFTDYFLKIRRILDLNNDIPHMTRGSAGSSLVCYLMGITDVDPVEWRIPLARFLNPNRDDLPDVDIDVPHHKQELAMQRIFDAWPNASARISNYVMYKEKSARREAARRLGARRDSQRRGVRGSPLRRSWNTPSARAATLAVGRRGTRPPLG